MAMGSALVKPFTVIVLLWILQAILSSISTFGVRQNMFSGSSSTKVGLRPRSASSGYRGAGTNLAAD